MNTSPTLLSLPKSRAAVFEQAARALASEAFCCHAIEAVSKDPKVLAYFEAVLRPRNRREAGQHPDFDMWDWAAWYGWQPCHMPSNTHARVFGLLLCAQLVREGFKVTPYRLGK